jgi:hypothetical protein
MWTCHLLILLRMYEAPSFPVIANAARGRDRGRADAKFRSGWPETPPHSNPHQAAL